MISYWILVPVSRCLGGMAARNSLGVLAVVDMNGLKIKIYKIKKEKSKISGNC